MIHQTLHNLHRHWLLFNLNLLVKQVYLFITLFLLWLTPVL